MEKRGVGNGKITCNVVALTIMLGRKRWEREVEKRVPARVVVSPYEIISGERGLQGLPSALVGASCCCLRPPNHFALLQLLHEMVRSIANSKTLAFLLMT